MYNQAFTQQSPRLKVRPLLWFSALLCVALLQLTGCAGKEVNPDDPESIYREAEDLAKDERYLLAIEKYRDLKNRFPYHSRATDSELRIADAYFDQESFLEAESAYEIFAELHPTHPRSDYVQYRIALSYFNEIPSNTSRDLTAAYKAIDAFEKLINKYPNSEFVAKAKQSIIESRGKLADHESYVADFYYQKHYYLSATYRYNSLLAEFPGLGFDEEALFRLGESYFNILMFGNAKDSFNRLLSQFPDSTYKGPTQGYLEQIAKKN